MLAHAYVVLIWINLGCIAESTALNMEHTQRTRIVKQIVASSSKCFLLCLLRSFSRFTPNFCNNKVMFFHSGMVGDWAIENSDGAEGLCGQTQGCGSSTLWIHVMQWGDPWRLQFVHGFWKPWRMNRLSACIRKPRQRLANAEGVFKSLTDVWIPKSKSWHPLAFQFPI